MPRRKAVGFYTDSRGRRRPITTKKQSNQRKYVDTIVMYAYSEKDLDKIIKYLKRRGKKFEVHREDLAVVTSLDDRTWDYAHESDSVQTYVFTWKDEVEKEPDRYFPYEYEEKTR